MGGSAVVLAPDSRALLLDALRPPSGHSLDHAVATTFTLDLESALTVPLAFAGFRFDEQPDPVEVMEALRGMSERLDIFCQAGAIHAGKWPSDLVALLESGIHAVRPPEPGHIFHPKIWVLRFLDGSQEPSYRLLVLSRNLTASRSWDTILWLDGRAVRWPNATSAPLAQFVRELPGLAVTPVPPVRHSILTELADQLRRVEWELPNGVREARFHPIGLPHSRRFPVEEHFSGYRKLAISPYVRAGALRRILRPRVGQTAVLVSRGEELDALPSDALEHLDVYELDPAVSLSLDDAEGTRTRPSSHICTPSSSSLSAPGWRISSSARPTRRTLALGQNVEFLCELVGPVAKLGVDAIVGEDAPFRAMLTPYVASADAEVDEASEAGRELEDLLRDIAGGSAFAQPSPEGSTDGSRA